MPNEPDIFDVWDAEPNSVHPVEIQLNVGIECLDHRLWLLNGCIMLHEDGKNE